MVAGVSAELSGIAPGSVVIVRDEEWLVTKVEPTNDGRLLSCRGLSELVRDTTASFYEGLDTIEALDPAEAIVVARRLARATGGPGCGSRRRCARPPSRSTARPSPSPPRCWPTRSATSRPPSARRSTRPTCAPRILLADAVGLGKTLEIGMILSELIRRGRGERILIVTPRHVLEQMQNEMWSRFAHPVRPAGLARHPAGPAEAARHPEPVQLLQAGHHLDRHAQERPVPGPPAQAAAGTRSSSTSPTTSPTPARRTTSSPDVLAPQTDALILASATPHNGKPESFAELIRLLEPTAVRPDGDVIEDEVRRLIIRRHRHSPEVASVVGADWAERKEPQNWLVPASDAENAVARRARHRLAAPGVGPSPYSGADVRPVPVDAGQGVPVLAGRPAASRSRNACGRLGRSTPRNGTAEIEALAAAGGAGPQGSTIPPRPSTPSCSSYLRTIGIGPKRPERVVIFAERVATLKWLQRAPADRPQADRQAGSRSCTAA